MENNSRILHLQTVPQGKKKKLARKRGLPLTSKPLSLSIRPNAKTARTSKELFSNTVKKLRTRRTQLRP